MSDLRSIAVAVRKDVQAMVGQYSEPPAWDRNFPNGSSLLLTSMALVVLDDHGHHGFQIIQMDHESDDVDGESVSRFEKANTHFWLFREDDGITIDLCPEVMHWALDDEWSNGLEIGADGIVCGVSQWHDERCKRTTEFTVESVRENLDFPEWWRTAPDGKSTVFQYVREHLIARPRTE